MTALKTSKFADVEVLIRSLAVKLHCDLLSKAIPLAEHFAPMAMPSHAGETRININELQELASALFRFRRKSPHLFEKVGPLQQVEAGISVVSPQSFGAALKERGIVDFDTFLDVIGGDSDPQSYRDMVKESYAPDPAKPAEKKPYVSFVKNPSMQESPQFKEQKAYRAQQVKITGAECGICHMPGVHQTMDCTEPCRDPRCRIENHNRTTGDHKARVHLQPMQSHGGANYVQFVPPSMQAYHAQMSQFQQPSMQAHSASLHQQQPMYRTPLTPQFPTTMMSANNANMYAHTPQGFVPQGMCVVPQSYASALDHVPTPSHGFRHKSGFRAETPRTTEEEDLRALTAHNEAYREAQPVTHAIDEDGTDLSYNSKM